jgi:N-acetylmuramoyl-L-alanine amidase
LNLFVRYPVALVALAALVLVAGCQGQAMDAGHAGLSAPLGTISVYQLAGRLGLSVRDSGRSMATLADDANVVTVYPNPGGGAYVNGASLMVAGSIAPVGDMIFVPTSLADDIRPRLRRAVRRAPSLDPAPTASVFSSGGPVFVDPGHGGVLGHGGDPGATSVLGMYEKDIVLDTARAVASSLRGQGVPVRMTRDDDTFVELNDRADLANRAGAEAFVSIHADSCPNPAITGFTLYVAPQAGAETMALARAIERNLEAAGVSGRGIRRKDFRVLVRTSCPAVLVEIGYLSNWAEARQLASGDYRRRLAEAISQGIVEYCRTAG